MQAPGYPLLAQMSLILVDYETWPGNFTPEKITSLEDLAMALILALLKLYHTDRLWGCPRNTYDHPRAFIHGLTSDWYSESSTIVEGQLQFRSQYRDWSILCNVTLREICTIHRLCTWPPGMYYGEHFTTHISITWHILLSISYFVIHCLLRMTFGRNKSSWYPATFPDAMFH